jgi:hypothetical protein
MYFFKKKEAHLPLHILYKIFTISVADGYMPSNWDLHQKKLVYCSITDFEVFSSSNT